MRWSILKTAAIVSAALGVAACQQPPQPQLVSLQAPTKLIVVDGPVCLPVVETVESTIPTSPLPSCEEGGRGFGLVINQRSGKLSVLALGQAQPRVVNLDTRRPGVTSIDVGATPVDVALVGDGTVAAVISQTERRITYVDLWTMQAFAEVEIDGIPRSVAGVTTPEGTAATLVATSAPDALQLFAAPSCERPDALVDRRDHDPAETCAFAEEPAEALALALPSRPVSLAVDDRQGFAAVIYRDRDAVSLIALREDALGDGEACLDEEAQVPCEIAQVAWTPEEEEGARFGATSVKLDPLGFFVYVLDRPQSRLIVVDRPRRALIDASLAIEPMLQPFSTNPGINLVRSATAFSPEVLRVVLDDGIDGGTSVVRYELGARVAADNGQLYRLGVVTLECAFSGQAADSWQDFVLDPQARAESDEAACLFLPGFPMGGDPDLESNEELLTRRVFEENGALQAVTPVFALLDGDPREGRLVGRAQCTHPEELVRAMEAVADGQPLSCGTPLAPQPVARSVTGVPATFTDSPRADLIPFAETQIDLDNLQPRIQRRPFDLRLVNEQWTVAYEGAIPGLGGNERGLVDRTDGGRFITGGADLCAAGVEVGDHLRILSAPALGADCDVYRGDERLRTYEITEVSPFEVSIAVIDDADGEFVQELPRRSCFDRGLRYEVRPQDTWVVRGAQSGMGSPFEREGDQCVLREGATAGRLSGRVQTGEEYVGPYLSLRIHEGEVEPVEGLSYTFQVERNFGILGEAISPSRQESLVQSVLPAEVLFTPDLGQGRLVVVSDQGTDRIYVRNLTTGELRYLR